MKYYPHRWFWIVGGDATRVWSSAQGAFIPSDSPAYQAFLADGGAPTRIKTMAELAAVLEVQHPAGAPQTPASARYAHETAGVWFTPEGGATPVLIATDRQSQARLTSATAGPNAGPIVWKALDGTFVSLTLSDLHALHAKVQAFVMACYVHEAYLTANSATADISAGWPSNGS